MPVTADVVNDSKHKSKLEAPLGRLIDAAAGRPILVAGATFGSTSAHAAAGRLRKRLRRRADLRLGWKVFPSVDTWSRSWCEQRDHFGALVVISELQHRRLVVAVAEQAIDLALLRRPILWGETDAARGTLWRPRFRLTLAARWRAAGFFHDPRWLVGPADLAAALEIDPRAQPFMPRIDPNLVARFQAQKQALQWDGVG